MRGLGILVFCLLIALALPAGARQWRVQPDGGGDFPTIQAAVDGAADGDSILLAAGDYMGPGNWDVSIAGRSLSIFGPAGEEPTALIQCADEPDTHRAFYLDGSDVAFHWLGMFDGEADQGGPEGQFLRGLFAGQFCFNSPVFLGDKLPDFPLAVDDNLKRHGLDSAGR